MRRIVNERGEVLDHAWSSGARGGAPVVVIGHGVTANKDRAWAVTLADALGEAGLATLRFSFSGNGSSEGDFRDSTISKEVRDLGSVLDAVGEPACYVGHSMGAAVGVLRAAGDRRIRWLVSLAGMVHTREFARRKFGDLEPDRDVMWDKAECPLSRAFMDDMQRIDSVVGLGPDISVPWLFVHGTADTVVPHDESVELRAAAGGPTEMVSIDGADHLFSGEHATTMAGAVVAWLERVAPGG